MSDGSKFDLIAAQDMRIEIEAGKKGGKKQRFKKRRRSSWTIKERTPRQEGRGNVTDVYALRRKAITDAVAGAP
jgi:hypothetical protein